MKFSATVFAAFTALLASVHAAPTVEKRQSAAITDTTILQYALTLEHLEDTFYRTYLGQFDQAAFAAAGYPDWVRNRIEQISSHESQHVALLTGALGSAATAECTYKFPVTDVKSFVTLSQVIENVGVSAYLGAAPSISEPAYVGVAGSILTVEARHQGWLNSAVAKQAAWSGPYDTALGFSPVYTIAAQFITSCPSSNPTLPFKAFPALTLNGNMATYTGSAAGQYLVLYSGLDVKAFPLNGGSVSGVDLTSIQGFAYALVSSQGNATAVSDANIVAGPAIIYNPFTSKVANPPASF